MSNAPAHRRWCDATTARRAGRSCGKTEIEGAQGRGGAGRGDAGRGAVGANATTRAEHDARNARRDPQAGIAVHASTRTRIPPRAGC
ncbi:hypothetical protein EVAR_78599_1 [Eumeta japonica]|uniref:Uncharacterized protein n=1 Tax=Eumeta variegata TaxID=151549 RepID=A0A4C1U7N5_EUMVA|nr:hypothetical protein EVAR_78599_1 [Eumeta japonica]